MAGFVVGNNAESTVADSPLTSDATTLNVATGEGVNFPATFPYRLTIWDETSHKDPTDDSDVEIVDVTGRTTDALTIVRGKESTSGVEHSNGERVAMLITAGMFDDATHGLQNIPMLRESGDIASFAEKASPVNTDLVIIEDSADSNSKKKVQVGNLPGGSATETVVTKTTAYTATTGDNTILCNATSAAFTITLPAASGNSGIKYNIKKIDSSANVITIDADGSETIDGALTLTLSSQYDSYTIQCDGSAWYIL